MSPKRTIAEIREWRRNRYELWPTHDVTMSIADLDLLLAVADKLDTLSTPPADDVRKTPHSEICGVQRRWNGGHCICAATLPADDVREAVTRLSGHVFHGEHFKRPATVVEVSDLRLVLDAFTAAEVRPHGTVAPPADDVREALEAIWDDGNATGLDGWVGPGRGTSPIDPEAVEARRRAIEKNGSAFEVRPHGTVADAETKAQIIADLAESYAYVHAVSRTSSQVYKWLRARAEAAREVHP